MMKRGNSFSFEHNVFKFIFGWGFWMGTKEVAKKLDSIKKYFFVYHGNLSSWKVI